MIWFAATLGLCALLASAAVLYQARGKRRDRRLYPTPGRYVTAGGARYHIQERGAGPSVVLEAGIASTSLAWAAVDDALAQFAKAVTYDRAGLGWSDRAEMPRTLERVSRELHAVLSAASVPGPYLFVAHSFGGLIVRQFAIEHPDLVLGLVLLDPVDTAEWHPLSKAQKARLDRGVMLSRRGALLARLGVVRFALALLAAGQSRVAKRIGRFTAGKGGAVTERLAGEVRKLPERVWPMVRMHWSDEKCFDTMAEYLARLPENAAAAERAGWPRGIPAIVLTVAGAAPSLPDGYVHRIAARSGHWIQLDQPELVVAAVKEILNRCV